MNGNAPPLPTGFRNLTVSSGLRASATRRPEKVALIMGDARRTYKEVIARINRIANVGAQKLGLMPGDNVALISPNSMEFLEIVAGISDLGVAVATLNPKLTLKELADRLHCRLDRGAQMMGRFRFLDGTAQSLQGTKGVHEIYANSLAIASAASDSFVRFTLDR